VPLGKTNRIAETGMRGRTGEPLVKNAITIAVTFALMWLLIVVGLVLARPKGMRAADAARLMPDLVLLVRDLARDRTIPRRVRVRIWILLAWMASPIDAIPDVVPVIGESCCPIVELRLEVPTRRRPDVMPGLRLA
jgi:hypothetical protein